MTAPAYQDPAYTNGYEFTGGAGYALPTYPFKTPPELAGASPEKPYDIVIVGGGITLVIKRLEHAGPAVVTLNGGWNLIRVGQ